MDQILARVGLGSFRRQFATVHHHLHHGVVLGDLPDTAVGNAVAPTVAHIDDGCLIFSDQGRHKRGTHTLKLFKLIGLVIDREIGQLHGAAQNHIRLVPVGTEPTIGSAGPAALDLLNEHIHGQRTGHIAGLGASHAVADHAQQRPPSQFFNMKRVLILFPDAPNIRQAPALHRKHLSFSIDS